MQTLGEGQESQPPASVGWEFLRAKELLTVSLLSGLCYEIPHLAHLLHGSLLWNFTLRDLTVC